MGDRYPVGSLRWKLDTLAGDVWICADALEEIRRLDTQVDRLAAALLEANETAEAALTTLMDVTNAERNR